MDEEEVKQLDQKVWQDSISKYFEVLQFVHSRVIKILFNYTNQMNSIYSMHTFPVFLVHLSVLFDIVSEKLACFYAKGA